MANWTIWATRGATKTKLIGWMDGTKWIKLRATRNNNRKWNHITIGTIIVVWVQCYIMHEERGHFVDFCLFCVIPYGQQTVLCVCWHKILDDGTSLLFGSVLFACVHFVLIKWTQQTISRPRITWDDKKLIAIFDKTFSIKSSSSSIGRYFFLGLAQCFWKETGALLLYCSYFPLNDFEFSQKHCVAHFWHDMLNRHPMNDSQLWWW